MLSYYVDALWFESLGVADVFWTDAAAAGPGVHVFFAAARSSSCTDRFSR